jgi:hypothetical protein
LPSGSSSFSKEKRGRGNRIGTRKNIPFSLRFHLFLSLSPFQWIRDRDRGTRCNTAQWTLLNSYLIKVQSCAVVAILSSGVSTCIQYVGNTAGEPSLVWRLIFSLLKVDVRPENGSSG